MAALYGHIDIFNVGEETWESYLERFDQYVLANKIEKERQAPLLLTVMGTTTFKLLTNLVAPKKISELEVKDIDVP